MAFVRHATDQRSDALLADLATALSAKDEPEDKKEFEKAPQNNESDKNEPEKEAPEVDELMCAVAERAVPGDQGDP
eukprot:1990968-Alexandrium_andersonii.AAC.1